MKLSPVTQEIRTCPARGASERTGASASPIVRFALGSASVAIFAVLVAASRLEPDPSGFGTHRQLGLAECPTIRATGQQCPTCGMTTAVVGLVRGRPATAWRTNPAAVALTISAVAGAVWAGISAWKGTSLGFSDWDRPLAYGSVGMTLIALATWGIRWSQWSRMTER